jgi:regulator of sigma E protease
MNIFLNYVLPCIVILGVLILFHELGHYLVARWCGVKVLRFSVGFGRPLLRHVGRNGTEWVLAAIPLGGYVKMLGETDGDVPASELHMAFNHQSVGRRFAIVAAGPIFNLLLAVVLYWALNMVGSDELRPTIAPTDVAESPAKAAGVRAGDLVLSVDGDEIKSWQDLRWVLLQHAVDRSEVQLLVRTQEGEEAIRALDLNEFSLDAAGKEDAVVLMGLRAYTPPFPALIDNVEEGGAAALAGLRKGDEIIAIDGQAMASSQDVADLLHATPGQARVFTVRRAGSELELPVTTGEKTTPDGKVVGIIGVRFDISALFSYVRYGPGEALVRAVRLTWETSALSLKSIGQMITGRISVKNVSGPITIADFAGRSAQLGLAPFIRFLAFISISLGILNLLPVPVLDGGHLLYYAVEFLKGGPLSVRVMEVGQKIGLTLLLMLMAFAFYNDISRLIPA